MKKLIIILSLLISVFLLSLLGCISHTPAKIAFIFNRDEQYNNIYLMNTDGTNISRLTGRKGFITSFSWDPDSQKIAFSSHYTDSDQENYYESIYIVNIDGSNETRLTNNPQGSDYQISWSPDGKRLVFISNRDSELNSPIEEIYIMNSDGSAQVRLTHLNGQCSFPSWSPDGNQIIFIYQPKSGDVAEKGIYLINSDGTGIKPIYKNYIYQYFSPLFSSDWKKIYVLLWYPGSAIYSMDINGTNLNKIQEDTSTITSLCLSSDQNNLTFTSVERTRSPDGRKLLSSTYFINIMNPDGSNRIKIPIDNLESPTP